MSSEDQELLRQLVSAIKGDGFTGIGLIRQWQQLSDTLAAYVEEQEKWRAEQVRVNQEHASQLRAHDEQLRALAGQKPVAMTERSAYIAVAAVTVAALLMLIAVLVLNGGL